MRYFIILSFFASLLFILGCHLPEKLRKTEWTIPEVKEWASRSKEYPGWKGLLLYQGSDTLTHRFISRVIDEWVWFKIKRTELDLSDERIYSNASSAGLGYYYVDPGKNFIKVKDFEK